MKVELLKNNFRIGHKIPEMDQDCFREIHVFSYRILYKIISEEKAAIVGIVHGRRLLDQKSFLEE